jgi:RNA polymerase sigma factor CnrH
MPRRSNSRAALPGSPLISTDEPRTHASSLASDVKRLMASGDRDDARERFTALVDLQHRRALRIAYHYLRDADDAAEAVQDAFLKVFVHIATYSESRPFEVWFTRVLVNACLDRRKARGRRLRWSIPMADASPARPLDPPSTAPTPEQRMLTLARAGEVSAALAKLPARQREVFVLRYVGHQTPGDVSATLGLSEATVRVHLFRAIRRLRTLLER